MKPKNTEFPISNWDSGLKKNIRVSDDKFNASVPPLGSRVNMWLLNIGILTRAGPVFWNFHARPERGV